MLVTAVTGGIALYNYYNDPKNQTRPGSEPETTEQDSNALSLLKQTVFDTIVTQPGTTSDTTRMLEHYKAVLDIRKMQGDRTGEADIMLKIAGMYAARNNNTEALNYYTSASTVYEENADNAALAGLYYNIALLYQREGTVSSALKYFSFARSKYILIGDRQGADSCMQKMKSVKKKYVK